MPRIFGARLPRKVKVAGEEIDVYRVTMADEAFLQQWINSLPPPKPPEDHSRPIMDEFMGNGDWIEKIPPELLGQHLADLRMKAANAVQQIAKAKDREAKVWPPEAFSEEGAALIGSSPEGRTRFIHMAIRKGNLTEEDARAIHDAMTVEEWVDFQNAAMLTDDNLAELTAKKSRLARRYTDAGPVSTSINSTDG